MSSSNPVLDCSTAQEASDKLKRNYNALQYITMHKEHVNALLEYYVGALDLLLFDARAVVLDDLYTHSSNALIHAGFPAGKIDIPNFDRFTVERMRRQFAHPENISHQFLTHYLQDIAPRSLSVLVLDYCCTVHGSFEHIKAELAPPADLRLIFERQLLAPQALMLTTFNYRDGKGNTASDRDGLLAQFAAENGYQVRILPGANSYNDWTTKNGSAGMSYQFVLLTANDLVSHLQPIQLPFYNVPKPSRCGGMTKGLNAKTFLERPITDEDFCILAALAQGISSEDWSRVMPHATTFEAFAERHGACAEHVPFLRVVARRFLRMPPSENPIRRTAFSNAASSAPSSIQLSFA